MSSTLFLERSTSRYVPHAVRHRAQTTYIVVGKVPPSGGNRDSVFSWIRVDCSMKSNEWRCSPPREMREWRSSPMRHRNVIFFRIVGCESPKRILLYDLGFSKPEDRALRRRCGLIPRRRCGILTADFFPQNYYFACRKSSFIIWWFSRHSCRRKVVNYVTIDVRESSLEKSQRLIDCLRPSHDYDIRNNVIRPPTWRFVHYDKYYMYRYVKLWREFFKDQMFSRNIKRNFFFQQIKFFVRPVV